MATIDSAYQYYLSTYGVSSGTRYDTHKKSQLRAVYNNIVKVNKESPLYKIKYSGEVQRFAIDLKEKTRSIQNMIASLSSEESGLESAFAKKVAQSSDEDSIGVQYIGSSNDTDSSETFEVEVRSLATPQINEGEYLSPNGHDFKPGTYSFDLNTNMGSFEFQYNVNGNNTNQDVQEKIIRLINSSNIGLKADYVTQGEKGAIHIESMQTGHAKNEDYLFEIVPSPDSGSIKAMQTLGIHHVTESAQNSSFLLNGLERSSLSNTFTVNNNFELTLKKISTDGASRIGFKANSDAVADNVQSLVNVYNSIIKLGHDSANTQNSNKLLRDMEGVAKSYHNELEAIGLQMSSEGYISIDRNLLTDAITADDSKESFSVLNRFKDGLNEKAASASIDPMNYVSKVLVAYKNPGHNFSTPYVISIYSGMMLDRYC